MTTKMVFHLNIKVYTLKDIPLMDMLKRISAFVDKALSSDEEMLNFHEKTSFKYYCISGFGQIEEDKVYRAGNVYDFYIRTIDPLLASFFCKAIPQTESKELKGIVCEKKEIKKVLIHKIYSITPIIARQDGEYWRNTNNVELFEQKITSNALQKYYEITGTEQDPGIPFFDTFRLLNHKPCKFSYKNIMLLGDKVELEISANEQAQDIAYLLLGTGIGELNARGFGMVNYRAF